MVAPAKTIHSLANGAKAVSKRLIVSYVVDWILILGVAAVGGGFSKIVGARHAFSLDDPNISFPDRTDTVSVVVLLIVSVVAPGVITAIVSLLFESGPSTSRPISSALRWRRKLWEWNTAWMGLGVALAGAFMITEGLKDLAGKPRPHLLAVCQPDTSPDAIKKYQVGGLGQTLESAVPIMVDWHICQTSDGKALRDAFASWPSGHSSFSWAGMLYLTLFLSSKFAIQLPLLPSASSSRNRGLSFMRQNPSIEVDEVTCSTTTTELQRDLRNEAAAPPVYLLIIAFIPIGVALFISVSRWFDYKHHGLDILSGSLIGIFMAWFGFRWYHLPIQTGTGASWGPRSRNRAFWLGFGNPTYVGNEGWDSARSRPREDVESAETASDGGILGYPEPTSNSTTVKVNEDHARF